MSHSTLHGWCHDLSDRMRFIQSVYFRRYHSRFRLFRSHHFRREHRFRQWFQTVIEYWHCNAENQGGLTVDELVKTLMRTMTTLKLLLNITRICIRD